MRKYNFVTIGFDCSPAGALKNANLREAALPFDWIVSSTTSLDRCFNDNFSGFHTELKYNNWKTILIDKYGFEFPHDYPTVSLQKNSDISCNLDNIGEGNIVETVNTIITPDWMKYYDVVNQKYNRRIKRFLDIVNNPLPIILCRYSVNEVKILKQLFSKYYNKHNVVFVNSTKHVDNSSPYIVNCFTEINGVWNDQRIWQETINKVIESDIYYTPKRNFQRMLFT